MLPMISNLNSRSQPAVRGLPEQLPASGTPSEAFGYNDQELLSVKTDTQNAWLSQMTWDYAGRRVELYASSTDDTWRFIYDPTASVPSVLAEIKNGDVEAFYVREPEGELLARVAGETRQYYFFDGLGSVQAICPASEGNPTDRYFHTPWGEPDARTETLSGTPGNPYRYVGQLGYYTHHQDANLSDWMQLGVRFYQPEIGRFERRDPVVQPRFCAYEYAHGIPAVLVDPWGEWALCGGFTAGAGLVVGRGGLAGWGMLHCYDSCYGWRTLWYAYVCSCVGAYVGVSFNLTPCVLRHLAEASAGVNVGAGWEFVGGGISFSGTGACIGGGLGLEFGAYVCRCRFEGTFQ